MSRWDTFWAGSATVLAVLAMLLLTAMAWKIACTPEPDLAEVGRHCRTICEGPPASVTMLRGRTVCTCRGGQP